jgi:hypothetical protein
MALKWETKYPGNTNAGDTDYPQGSARNDTSEGAKDGFPQEKSWINDFAGLFQGLLKRAGISPSGNPDTVDVSDYQDALFDSGLFGNAAISGVSLTKLQNGSVTLVEGDKELVLASSYVNSKDTDDNTYIRFQARSGSDSESLVYESGVNGEKSYLSNLGHVGISKVGPALNSVRTNRSGLGNSFSSGPGTESPSNLRPAVFDASALVWTGSGSQTSITGLDLTNIPFVPGTLVKSVAFSGTYTDLGVTSNIHAPAYVELGEGASGDFKVTKAVCLTSTLSLNSLDGLKLIIEFDASNVTM